MAKQKGGGGGVGVGKISSKKPSGKPAKGAAKPKAMKTRASRKKRS